MVNHPNRKSAAEIIGTWFGTDIAEIRDAAYQRTRNPTLYVIYGDGFDYVCCPTSSQNPPKDRDWFELGELYGRKIFAAK